jgi:hypothetical protein
MALKPGSVLHNLGYTGETVVAVPRAIRSLSLGDWTGGINLFDPKLGYLRARELAVLADGSWKERF